MHYFTNHCWCSGSNWGGNYDCRYIIGIKRYKNYDPNETNQDWIDLIVEVKDFFKEEEYKRIKLIQKDHPNIDDATVRSLCQGRTYRLKDEVIQWLEENVKDRKDEDIPKGWCMGSDEYNSNSGISLDLFFHRRRDALAFVKRWSEHKKPVTYFDYFKDIRKELNMETMKLETVTKFTR